MRHLFIGLLCLLAGPFATAAEFMFEPPKGATGGSHIVLQPGVAEQDSFWLDEAFPSSSAIDHYSRVLAKWRACHIDGGEGWLSFTDASTVPPRFIHQFSRTWVNPSNDVMVTVAVRYASSSLENRKVPDSRRQSVVVLRHKAKNASATILPKGAKCETAI